MSELEVRHYIGVTPLGRMHATLGPGEPSSFTLAATEPMPVGDTWLYPVSFEVAEEWDSFDEDDDGDEFDSSVPHPTGYPNGGAA